MASSFRQLFLLFTMTALLLPTCWAAASLGMDNYNMQLYGSVSASSDGKIIPTANDTVIAINLSTNAVEMTAPLQNNGTGYQMQISKPSTFSGTKLKLFIQQSNTTYKLLNSSGTDAIVAFNGIPGFFPQMVQVNVVASSIVSGTSTGTGDGTGTGTGSSGSLIGDINGDGAVNETDIQLLKQAISGQTPIVQATMDINRDGVVNTRDLIDLIRIVREGVSVALKPVSIIPAHP